MDARILIVEDEILVGMMLQKNIEGAGVAQCEIATSGEEAIRTAKEFEPDLLLMDFSLPGTLDGIDAAQEIRRQREIPVIFFSGNNRDEELLKRAACVEPLGVVDKMDHFEQLLAVIRTGLASDGN